MRRRLSNRPVATRFMTACLGLVAIHQPLATAVPPGAKICCYGIPNRSSPPPAPHGCTAFVRPRNPPQPRRLRLSAVHLSRRRRAQGSALYARRLQPLGGRRGKKERRG